MKDCLKFYSKFALFSVREEQSSLSGTLGGLILYPCFILIYSKLWLGLNNNLTSLGVEGLFVYIGLTEILFMTSLREPLIDRACTDFALSFVRPRFWPTYVTISIYSRTMCRRLLYLSIFIIIMPLFIRDFTISIITLRFLIFIPFLTILDTLYSFLFAILQIRLHTVKNFRMLFGKLFLIFGGVLAPFSDIPQPWNKIFLSTPFSDLIFQPCYFSIKGHFYQISFFHWLTRIFVQLISLLILSTWAYKSSRNHYHNFGG